ncbi:MAG TPA: PIN domain-containing protein [Aggregatilineales bacterium]|nr:PIN domain-containing protein [Aggregatilineales bacterium]
MAPELIFRFLGMLVLAFAGARFGVQIAVSPQTTDVFALAFGLIGALTGLIITPYFTTRPARVARRAIRQMPAEVLVASIFGLIFGLIVAALFSVPLGLLPDPFREWVPSIVAVVAAYLSITIFAYRAQDVFRLVRDLLRGNTASLGFGGSRSDVKILLDTSVIIDGRVLDISRTGFVFGTLLVPQFVLAELQHIADSGEAMRRSRGRRGLEVLEELQRESKAPVQVIPDDVEGVREVDDKLVVLAKQMEAVLMTNDYNLNQVASLQGVDVLNINELANAIKAALLPGQTITVQIVQEGREHNQGVGYLPDGTMIVVEEGVRYMDRTIDVTITRMIQTAAGKMYFARPEDNIRR